MTQRLIVFGGEGTSDGKMVRRNQRLTKVVRRSFRAAFDVGVIGRFARFDIHALLYCSEKNTCENRGTSS